MVLVLLVGFKHLGRLFLSLKWIKNGVEKNLTTMIQSFLIQSWGQPQFLTNSMNFEIVENPTKTKDSIRILSAKTKRKSSLLFLEMLPHLTTLVIRLKASSQLHLIQHVLGGFQRTYFMLGALEGLIETSNTLIVEKSNIEIEEELVVLLPANFT